MADDLMKIVNSLRRFRNRNKFRVKYETLQSDCKVPMKIMCEYLEDIANSKSGEFRQPPMTERLTRYSGWYIVDMEMLKKHEEDMKKEMDSICKREVSKREAEASAILDKIISD